MVIGQKQAHVAQSVERVLGKDEVTSSILVVGSRKAGVTQWLESRPSKPLVAGSNPVSRSLHRESGSKRGFHGEREIRENEAARERGDDRSHRSWEDDADGLHYEGAGEEQSESEIPVV